MYRIARVAEYQARVGDFCHRITVVVGHYGIVGIPCIWPGSGSRDDMTMDRIEIRPARLRSDAELPLFTEVTAVFTRIPLLFLGQMLLEKGSLLFINRQRAIQNNAVNSLRVLQGHLRSYDCPGVVAQNIRLGDS